MTLHTKCRTVSCLCPVTAGREAVFGHLPLHAVPYATLHVRRARWPVLLGLPFTNHLPVVLD